ncbi:MAG: FMN-binding protein [Actinomycetota bacterium]
MTNVKRNVLIAVGATVGVSGFLFVTHSSKGIFTGTAVDVSYGTIQVQITVVDGKMTDVVALQSPKGRSASFSKYAIPVLKEQTLAAQSAKIQGATGASYTSFGWKTSLQAALNEAHK